MSLKMKLGRRTLVIVAILALVLVLGASATAEMAAGTGPTEMVEPVDVTLVADTGPCIGAVGAIKVVDVVVHDVEHLYGASFQIRYDPQVLEVVDADPSLLGVQISTGMLFESRGQPIIRSADEETGIINYVHGFVLPASAVSGTGSMARITFRVKQMASTELTFEEGCYLPKDLRVWEPGGSDRIQATWHDAEFYGDCHQLYVPRVSVQ